MIMKKIYLLLTLLGGALFMACDPVEDDYSNNFKAVASADEIKATVTVEQQNGKNVNKVHIDADGNNFPIQLSNGVNTSYGTVADFLLFGEGSNTVYISTQNPDGSLITKEITVNVDEMYYDVPKEYNLLTNLSSKTWTWDTEVTGGSWGNLGYMADSGENFAATGSGGWWSCNPNDLSGQLNHSSTGVATGEEDVNAYMIWSLNGTKIETFTPGGSLIRSGKFSIENYDSKIDGWSIGTLNTTAESILFPWQINSGGYAPTAFEVIQLDEQKMVLVYASSGTGQWGEATFWRFKAK